MRITFVIASLSSGGAERVVVSLATGFISHKHLVSVVTLNGRETDFYELPESAERRSLNISGLFQTISGLLKLRRSILSTKPDVIISFIDTTNVLTLWASLGLNVPVVVSERADPKMHRIGKIWDQLRRWTYPSAKRIVVQTSGALTYFLPQFESKVCVIPNPVLLPKISNQPIAHLPKPLLIAVGRLVYEKGFDLLLKAFAGLKGRHPEWKLIILGEGPLRKILESLKEMLGLSGRVFLPGRMKNPYDFLKQADLFVLSSRSEGFPNALCEAMASGLPVIAMDCRSGPREIIRDGTDGILIPQQDIGALTEGMDRLMSNQSERQRLASHAVEIVERFGLEKVITIWERTLFEVLREA